MSLQTLLLDDYGMFLLRRLYEVWNELLAMQSHSSPVTQAASWEFQMIFDDLFNHLILLLEHPDIPLRREDEPHLILDSNIVETLIQHLKHRDSLRQAYTPEASHGVSGTRVGFFNSIEVFWNNNPLVFHL